MDLKQLPGKLKQVLQKYKYAALVLAIGLILLTLPGKSDKTVKTDNNISTGSNSQALQAEALAEILRSVQGAGNVQVLLSVSSGEKTVYQTNTDNSVSGDNTQTRIETVITTDSQRNETGLINQVNPPIYLGAIVVCEGADSASVRLAITQAVAKITGLGADAICVLKMK